MKVDWFFFYYYYRYFYRYFSPEHGFVISPIPKCISVKSFALSKWAQTLCSVSLHIFRVNAQIKRELIETMKGKKDKNKIDFSFLHCQWWTKGHYKNIYLLPNLIEMLYIRVIWIRGQGWGEQLKRMGLSLCACCRQEQIGDLKGRQRQYLLNMAVLINWSLLLMN